MAIRFLNVESVARPCAPPRRTPYEPVTGMKIIHCADVHLDSPLHGLERYDGAPVEEMRAATRRAFANVVDLCAEEDAKVLLLAGGR